MAKTRGYWRENPDGTRSWVVVVLPKEGGPQE
jgi:hypothetical protein